MNFLESLKNGVYQGLQDKKKKTEMM